MKDPHNDKITKNPRYVNRTPEQIRTDARKALASKQMIRPKEEWLREVAPNLKTSPMFGSHEEDYDRMVAEYDKLIKDA